MSERPGRYDIPDTPVASREFSRAWIAHIRAQLAGTTSTEPAPVPPTGQLNLADDDPEF